MRISKKKLLIIIVLLSVSIYGLFGNLFKPSSEDSKHEKKGGNPISVATAKKGDIDVYLNGLGNVTPRNIAVLRSRVDGQLMRVLFHEGQDVRENELLAELDSTPYEAQLKQAEGQLLRDQALLDNAKIDLERYRVLFSQDSISKQQLDTQTALVKQYEGNVRNDQGTVDAAKVQIGYTKIKAPFSGRVGLRQVDPGNIIHTSDQNGIVVVTQLQPITVTFSLPEDTIPSIMDANQDKKLTVAAWDRENKAKIAEGVLIAVDNQVDSTTGTVKLRADFPNKDNALFPSQFVNVRLKLTTQHESTLVPTAAIQHGTDGAFVYLVNNDNTVHVQPVVAGTIENNTVAVLSGLNPSDVVVIDGVDALKEGAKISISDAEKPSEKATHSDTPSKEKKKKHSPESSKSAP